MFHSLNFCGFLLHVEGLRNLRPGKMMDIK